MALVKVAFEVALWVFILRAIIDFFPPLEKGKMGRVVRSISEPVLAPARRVLRPVMLGDAAVDFSAIVTVLLLYFLRLLIDRLV